VVNNLVPGKETIRTFYYGHYDVLLEALQFAFELRDQANNKYLQSEYQNLSDQAEEFAVALIDEVNDRQELALVMNMADRWNSSKPEDILLWTGKKMNQIRLMQHAINLRCKSVSEVLQLFNI
jgi:hypothetical protein